MSTMNNAAADVPELQAIVFTSHVLRTFKDNDARLRVLRGVCKYFGLSVAVVGPGAPQRATDTSLDVPAFEELVAVAAENSRRFNPGSNSEYAMAGSSPRW